MAKKSEESAPKAEEAVKQEATATPETPATEAPKEEAKEEVKEEKSEVIASTEEKEAEKKPAAKKTPAKKTTTKKDEVKAEAKAEDKSEAKADDAPAKPKRTRKKIEKPAEVAEEAPASEEAPAEEAEEVPAPVVETKDFKTRLKEFDWTKLDKKSEIYAADEREKMEKAYDESLTSITEHTVIDGTVVTMTAREIVVNIGYKSEGVIPSTEFRHNPDLKIGDKVETYVEKTEDQQGQLVLSHKKARMMRAWENVNEAKETDKIVTGFVKCRTKGGLIVDVFGLEAFLPGSQIDVKPIRDYDIYVGKNMQFKVVKINHEFKNVVVSHKALIEAEIEQQKVEIMQKLEKGQVLEGTVKNITSYGVFIDLGGVDGLIHITDLSWGRINHPEEVVQLDETINVVILDFDDEKKRIALGVKQLQDHPWDGLNKEMKEGDTIKGKVVVLADYGAFVEVAAGVEGLIHVSEMNWSQHLRTADQFFKVGDEVDAKVIAIDREERKLSLSTRQLTPDPWADIEKRYPVDSKHTGKVTNLSNFGDFVELEEGINGLTHISDLSWSKKINHPSEFTKVSEDMEVVVLEIDKENRRLSLGHKQMEENPWDVFETVFTIGSEHQGTITSRNDKGGVVNLPYGVEGFAPSRHLTKADGSKAAADEVLEFQIIEFSKDAKKIIVSHTKTHDAAGGAIVDKGKKRTSKPKGDNRAVKKINESIEKTTLGDLGVLEGLKDQMEQQEKD
ncbi:MAG: 30S ribosomal protein S1 [Bacteroidetes bacterium]|nr:30S ribosomal protein S1 [Bacteroidota bacterium]